MPFVPQKHKNLQWVVARPACLVSPSKHFNLEAFLFSCLSYTMRTHLLQNIDFLSVLFSLLFTLPSVIVCGSHSISLFIPSDASALLAFKAKADLWNKLDEYSSSASFAFCEWRGVECSQAKVVRFVIEGIYLGGVLAPKTLSRLDQLRVLSLQNNSLTGPIPDLSALVNLKVLFLGHNSFSGSIPASLTTLHRLKTLDLSDNHLIGQLPFSLNKLDRLYHLRLDSNRFNGSVPPLNQSTLETFNISNNKLTGAIPVTPTLLRFMISSFSLNPGLCGEIVHKECHEMRPFFGPANPPPPMALAQNAHESEQGTSVELSQSGRGKHRKPVLVIGLTISGLAFIGSLICIALARKKQRSSKASSSSPKMAFGESTVSVNVEAVKRIEEENSELEEKVKRVQEDMQRAGMGRSGNLVFCGGESQPYSLEQLMRASAELLGRGTMGTTYKAVLDNRLIVCVKRLDASRLSGRSKDDFELHMESVGCLRHPNLVPLRAYFQAKEERLLIYDYQPNGSLFSLIHGSKSARAKPLHWTSCLKIAEDVAKGLSYIHQARRLVHGNLTSSNVLLGSDFEACLTDFCLSTLANPIPDESPDSTAYRAPEVHLPNSQDQDRATSKSDVYSFGILLLELLSGKHPSQHPYLMPNDMMNWVRINRDEESGEDNKLGMILEVAIACSMTSPDQRPTMWQVLKIIQGIKEVVTMKEDELMNASTTGAS